jgi:hypothetical protein
MIVLPDPNILSSNSNTCRSYGHIIAITTSGDPVSELMNRVRWIQNPCLVAANAAALRSLQ